MVQPSGPRVTAKTHAARIATALAALQTAMMEAKAEQYEVITDAGFDPIFKTDFTEALWHPIRVTVFAKDQATVDVTPTPLIS